MGQPSRHGRHRHAKPVRDVRVAAPRPIEQDQHQTIRRPEAREHLAHERGVIARFHVHDDVAGVGGGGRLILGNEPKSDPSKAAVALRQDEALDPAGEGVRLAKLIQSFPRGEKRILRRVLRERGIAKPRARAGERQVLETAHELREGLMPDGLWLRNAPRALDEGAYGLVRATGVLGLMRDGHLPASTTDANKS